MNPILPSELFIETIRTLMPNDLLQQCNINKIIKRYCANDEFWQTYLKEMFNITVNPTFLSWKEVTMLLNVRLNKLFNYQVYPSSKFLQYVLYLSDDEFNELLSTLGTKILATSQLFFKYVDNIPYHPVPLPSVNPTNNYPINPHIHYQFTPDELFFYQTVLKYVLRPTIYYTPNGPITINYDKEMLYNILMSNSNPLYDVFLGYITDKLDEYEDCIKDLQLYY